MAETKLTIHPVEFLNVSKGFIETKPKEELALITIRGLPPHREVVNMGLTMTQAKRLQEELTRFLRKRRIIA